MEETPENGKESLHSAHANELIFHLCLGLPGGSFCEVYQLKPFMHFLLPYMYRMPHSFHHRLILSSK